MTQDAWENGLSTVPVKGLCWPVPPGSYLDKDGYAVALIERKRRSPSGKIQYKRRALHLVMYELLIGPVPEGLVADHLCRTRNCINPWHLEFVSIKENILRGLGTGAQNKQKTHASCGHPFDGVYGKKNPQRVCLSCAREKAREQTRRKQRARKFS